MRCKRRSIRHKLQPEGGQFEGRVFRKIIDFSTGLGVISVRRGRRNIMRRQETGKDMFLRPGIDDTGAIVVDPLRTGANAFGESTSKTVIRLVVDHVASLSKGYDIIYDGNARRFKQHLRLKSPLPFHACNRDGIKSAQISTTDSPGELPADLAVIHTQTMDVGKPLLQSVLG